uniref:Putative secreted protein n=1 Tax=Ixodes ricinus TaxID=34613 RepID=A0A6B0U7S6_IXORI
MGGVPWFGGSICFLQITFLFSATVFCKSETGRGVGIPLPPVKLRVICILLNRLGTDKRRKIDKGAQLSERQSRPLIVRSVRET